MASRHAGIKVRAITRFIVLSADSATWAAHLKSAYSLARGLAATYDTLGYTVQSLRIVTNPFGEFLDCSSIEAALVDVAKLKAAVQATQPGDNALRLRMSLGAARSLPELALVPALIQAHGDLCNICVNIPADPATGLVDAALCAAAADVMCLLARTTARGEGNFNFTANFCCPPLIPYFPAGYNTQAMGECFAIGLEHPDLLLQVLTALNVAAEPAEHRATAWGAAAVALRDAMETHTSPLAAAARDVAVASGVRFAGLDSSAAPSKDVASLCALFACLGVPRFGASGTTEAAAFLTRVFKSVRGVELIGFSGLMLTCLEDTGMAAAAADYDIRALQQYSCVCGIGLDCVPIPGDTPPAKIAALLRDTGTLAFRYNKPLTVRLFPCPGLQAGAMTDFQSSDLCNCTVFRVD